jgi:DNA-binding CsgD family transcriptional regulator
MTLEIRSARPEEYAGVGDLVVAGYATLSDRSPGYESVLRNVAARVWLPAPPGRARSIYLERSGKDYTHRERMLFQLLRPHLARMRLNAESRRQVDARWALTSREAEVLGWVARGKTNGEIAAALFISPLTVRKHLENIFEKLGVRTRTAATAYARAAMPFQDAEGPGASTRS